MDKEGVVVLLLIVGLGGLAVYIYTRPTKTVPAPVVLPPAQQCGASYAGVGASVPCTLLAHGVKELANGVASLATKTGIPGEVKTAASGIKTWEYVVTPVAITHVAINEIKRIPGLGWL